MMMLLRNLMTTPFRLNVRQDPQKKKTSPNQDNFQKENNKSPTKNMHLKGKEQIFPSPYMSNTKFTTTK